MKINQKNLVILASILLLTACGNDHPQLTQFKAFDERFTTVIDTKDPENLKVLGELFYDRQEASGAEGDLDFSYLFDITTAAGSERWRCTQTGYCQLRVEGAAPNREIFYLERHRELFERSNLN